MKLIVAPLIVVVMFIVGSQITWAGYITSNTEKRAFEQGWLIPICEVDTSCDIPSDTCSISRPSMEQLEELQTICQNNETGESKKSPSQCYEFLDSLVNLATCKSKNVVVTTSNGKTTASYKIVNEATTQPPPIYTILTPKVKKPLITPTKTQPTTSINPTITSTPSVTLQQIPNQKMSKGVILSEITRLIRLLISSLFRK